MKSKDKKYWSFVVFVQKRPLMYYPYKFNTKFLCKSTALILCDILHGDSIMIYDSRHYPQEFKDLPFAPVPNASKIKR